MQKAKIVTFLSAFILSQAASAGILVQSFVGGCDHFDGHWAGEGKVKAEVVFPIECRYRGVADVKALGGNKYNVHVDLTKTDGICPDHDSIDLPGVCQNNSLNLESAKANLHGSINDSGNEAKLEGTVHVDLMGSKVDAEVSDMVLHKQ
jgi:hypothetical protein